MLNFEEIKKQNTNEKAIIQKQLETLAEKLKISEAEHEKVSDLNVDLKNKAKNDQAAVDLKIKTLEKSASQSERGVK